MGSIKKIVIDIHLRLSQFQKIEKINYFPYTKWIFRNQKRFSVIKKRNSVLKLFIAKYKKI